MESIVTQYSAFLLVEILVLAGCAARPAVDVTLANKTVEIGRPVIAGEQLECKFELVNNSTDQIVITGATTGCGCSRIRIGGESVPEENASIQLPLGNSAVELIVHTQMKGGPTEYGFIVTYCALESQTWGKLQGRVVTNVRRGLIAQPSVLSVAAERLSAMQTIEILDDLPADYSISRIEVSDPASISVDPVDIPVSEQSPIELDAYQGTFIIRRKVQLRFIERERIAPSNMWIRIHPSYSRDAPLHVPIYIRPPVSDIVLTPTTLAVQSFAHDDTIERSVTLVAQSSLGDEVTAQYPQDQCVVTFLPGLNSSERVAKIRILPSSGSRTFEIVFHADGKKVATLPVNVLGDGP